MARDEERVKARLRRYLMRDENGIRRAVLRLFLTGESLTTSQIYERLLEKGIEVNYRGVSAIVGLMNTRLGILRISVGGDHNLYSLKPEHTEIVRSMVEN